MKLRRVFEKYVADRSFGIYTIFERRPNPVNASLFVLAKFDQEEPLSVRWDIFDFAYFVLFWIQLCPRNSRSSILFFK